MKQLLILTAVLEWGAGLALIICPSQAVVLLLGSPLDSLALLALGRIGGTALLALGIANWIAHYDCQSRASRGLVMAMLVYNFGTVLILGATGIQSQVTGIILWPAVSIHMLMAGWCIVNLLKKI